jgi:hypothetical protein
VCRIAAAVVAKARLSNASPTFCPLGVIRRDR